jgi:hypothetical protein
MAKASRSVRSAFGVATLRVILALTLHVSNWIRQGTVNWAAAVNMVGLLVLVGTGVVDPPPGRLRLTLGVVAVLLIVPSAILMLVSR